MTTSTFYTVLLVSTAVAGIPLLLLMLGRMAQRRKLQQRAAEDYRLFRDVPVRGGRRYLLEVAGETVGHLSGAAYAQDDWRYIAVEDECGGCGHGRRSHLDQPFKRGGPPVSDRGWCTLPEGSCIFSRCKCVEFVELPVVQGRVKLR